MSRGFTLVEMIIVSAVFSLFFGGLFATVQNSLQLISVSRERIAAVSIASDQLEYIRSLSYNNVGTISGLPNGPIPQTSTTTLNGILFTQRTLIEFIDDAADGIGGADTNSITTDYKRAKVEVSWMGRTGSSSVSYVTTVVPRSIETNVGGGTIRVNVRDATIQPVSGAAVRLLNTTGTTTVDVTRYTDVTGAALFGGAPAGANYQVFVTNPGYSSDGTAVATGTLANPAQQPLAVVAADVTTATYFIDELADLDLALYASRESAMTARDATVVSDVAATSSTIVTASGVTLAGVPGSYSATGTVFFSPITPTPLYSWSYAIASTSIPNQTTGVWRVYTVGSSSYELIPDTDLPGNAAGFGGRIDLSALSIASYPSIVLGTSLASVNPAVTPTVSGVAVWYIESATPRASTGVTFTSTKVLGTTAALTAVPKHSYTGTTDTDGRLVISNMEWDAYPITSPSYTVREICGSVYPLAIAPGVTTTVTMVTGPAAAHSLRVLVTAGGVPVPGATVTLSNGAGTDTTSVCGQVYFHDLSPANDYVLNVTAPGYPSVEINPLDISGTVVEEIAL